MIDYLPNELILLIMEYLCDKDVLNVFLTSKHFNTFKHNYLYKSQICLSRIMKSPYFNNFLSIKVQKYDQTMIFPTSLRTAPLVIDNSL